MKIKVFSYSDTRELEKDVNEFISNVSVIDIKMGSSDKYTDILVIYDEKERWLTVNTTKQLHLMNKTELKTFYNLYVDKNRFPTYNSFRQAVKKEHKRCCDRLKMGLR